MKTILDEIPYARLLAVGLEGSGGHTTLVLPFRDEIVGNSRLPAIHGGVVGAFLELTALFEIIGQTEGQRIPKPINFCIDYLRSAGPKDLRGRADIVKHGRRIANVRVLAWQDDAERPVAAGIGNFLLRD